MLTGAVIKAEQVLVPFGKMEIRGKKNQPWRTRKSAREESDISQGNMQELKEKVSAGNWGKLTGKWGKQQNRMLESSKSRVKWGQVKGGKFHHHALSGRQRWQALPHPPDPVQTLRAHSNRLQKILFRPVSLLVEGDGKGAGSHKQALVLHEMRRERSGCRLQRGNRGPNQYEVST